MCFTRRPWTLETLCTSLRTAGAHFPPEGQTRRPSPMRSLSLSVQTARSVALLQRDVLPRRSGGIPMTLSKVWAVGIATRGASEHVREALLRNKNAAQSVGLWVAVNASISSLFFFPTALVATHSISSLWGQSPPAPCQRLVPCSAASAPPPPPDRTVYCTHAGHSLSCVGLSWGRAAKSPQPNVCVCGGGGGAVHRPTHNTGAMQSLGRPGHCTECANKGRGEGSMSPASPMHRPKPVHAPCLRSQGPGNPHPAGAPHTRYGLQARTCAAFGMQHRHRPPPCGQGKGLGAQHGPQRRLFLSSSSSCRRSRY